MFDKIRHKKKVTKDEHGAIKMLSKPLNQAIKKSFLATMVAGALVQPANSMPLAMMMVAPTAATTAAITSQAATQSTLKEGQNTGMRYETKLVAAQEARNAKKQGKQERGCVVFVNE